jgi:thioesterase III
MQHVTELKIRGYHLDDYGHVNNARWLELLEEARWRWLEETIDLRTWDDRGLGLAVMNIDVRFRRPAVRHDVLHLRVWMSRLASKGGTCCQRVFRAGTDELLVESSVTFVLFDRTDGHARAFDAAGREQLARFLEPGR